MILEEKQFDIDTPEQEFTSAKTSINSKLLPAIFRFVDFAPNTINLDYGGGKFDNASDMLEQRDVKNLVYDPFNRSKAHNDEVISIIKQNNGADTATLSNVLNVIKEPNVRTAILKNIRGLLKPNGTLYITVYEGNKSGEGKPSSSGYQENRITKDYIKEIQEVFPNVSIHGKLITAKS